MPFTLGTGGAAADIRSSEAEPAGCGGSPAKGENEAWPDVGRSPKGRGQYFRFLRCSSLADTRYASLLAPRPRKYWLPSPSAPKVNGML